MLKLLATAFLFLSVRGICQEVRISGGEGEAGIGLTEDARYFIDSSGVSRFKDIVGGKAAFSRYNNPKSFFSFSRYGVWIRCRIRNERPEKRSLYVLVDNSRIETLKLYIQKADGSVTEPLSGGWGKPIWQRPYPHYKNIFPFAIGPREALTFYIFTRTRYHPFNVPIVFTGHRELTRHVLITTLTDGSMLVICLFVFLISLFLLFESGKKDALYFWYCVYSFHVFLYSFLRIGIQYFNDTPLNPYINYLAEIPTVINLLSYGYFAVSFMTSVETNPVYRGFLQKALAVVGLASVIAYFAGPVPNVTAIFVTRTLLFVTFLVAVLYPLIQGIRQRNQDAYLFLVMLIPLMTGYVLLVWTSDISPGGGISNYMFLMKSVILLEASLMMFSVFYKSGKIKRQLFRKIADGEKQILRTQIQVQESERKRIASDLHDELGATIATVKREMGELKTMLMPEAAKMVVHRADTLISGTSNDLRRITHNLMPPHFEAMGLKDSISYLAKRATGKNLRFEFVAFGPVRPLGYEVEINLYRIVSELVHNIQKHSGASVASVQMIYFEDRLSIDVEDNGRGFEKPLGSPVADGIGLNTVRLRTDYIGATLRLDSGKSGTSVTIETPYK